MPAHSHEASATHQSAWNYAEAFSRNLGLSDPADQEKLRAARVAIAGMGGVGGVHLTTLARLGVGKFTVADPDAFELPNFNRQVGATTDTLGRNKAEVMADLAKSINPEIDVRAMAAPIIADNCDEFLAGADILVDGIDFFALDVRRMLFAAARRQGIWTVTAGPIGFSTAWLCFDPQGMSFDDYFDLHDGQERLDQVVAFAVGLTPKGTHLPYMDLNKVDARRQRGPSLSLACQLAGGVVAAETVKVLLGTGTVRAAPAFAQFDAYRCCLARGVVRGGNRNFLQRIKRRILKKKLAAAALLHAANE